MPVVQMLLTSVSIVAGVAIALGELATALEASHQLTRRASCVSIIGVGLLWLTAELLVSRRLVRWKPRRGRKVTLTNLKFALRSAVLGVILFFALPLFRASAIRASVLGLALDEDADGQHYVLTLPIANDGPLATRLKRLSFAIYHRTGFMCMAGPQHTVDYVLHDTIVVELSRGLLMHGRIERLSPSEALHPLAPARVAISGSYDDNCEVIVMGIAFGPNEVIPADGELQLRIGLPQQLFGRESDSSLELRQMRLAANDLSFLGPYDYGISVDTQALPRPSVIHTGHGGFDPQRWFIERVIQPTRLQDTLSLRWLFNASPYPQSRYTLLSVGIETTPGKPSHAYFEMTPDSPGIWRPTGHEIGAGAFTSWYPFDFLILAGAEVNSCDSAGRCPLHYAVGDLAGRADLVRRLLDAGADPNAQDTAGNTPLQFARHTDVAALLLASGANPNLRNRSGTVPLLSAVRNGNASLAIVLLAAGAYPNTADSAGLTPLHYAATLDSAQSHLLIPSLVAAGATLNTTDRHRRSPLHVAAASSRSAIVQLLCVLGSDPGIRNAGDSTALAIGLAALRPPIASQDTAFAYARWRFLNAFGYCR